MGDDAHTSETVSAGQLRAFIERIERVEEEIKELNGDKSDIYKELRACGFDVKAVRQCVAARKLDIAEREERTAIFELYWDALTGSSRVHVHEASEAIPPHDPETGEIIEPENHSEQPLAARPSASTGNASGEIPAIESLANGPCEAVSERIAELVETSVSAEAGVSGQPEMIPALTGQFPGANVSGSERAGVTAGETAPLSPSAISTRTVEETAEPAAATTPSPRATAEVSNPQPSSSPEADTAGDAPQSPSPATNFSNPRCRKPDSCHFAHSRDCCHDCLLAWGSKPRDEQRRLWQEAERAARECEVAA